MEGGVDAKKSLGQHWLNDEPSLETISTSIDISNDDTVLEIGPGLGSLTAKLANKAKKVIAVELDSKAIGYLTSNLNLPNLKIIHADILKFDLTTLPADYKVVANIPYYLTSNLLRVLCTSSNPFSQAALLVQKEVAQRAAAEPGKMSLLSVGVQLYCEVKTGQIIEANKFDPPPKVDSQILILNRRKDLLFIDIDNKKFFRLVRAGFSQRRKTLLNSLSGGLGLNRDEVSGLIELAGILPTRRPQTLSLEEWHKLYREIN